MALNIYYRIYGTDGLVNVKQPLSDITDDKAVGRIASSDVMPTRRVEDLKLAIAQHEGLGSMLEAYGAELYLPSSSPPTESLDNDALPSGVGSSLRTPVSLKFLCKLRQPQNEPYNFAGSWSFTSTGSDSRHRYKSTFRFTLTKASDGTITANGNEQRTTTYTGFVHHRSHHKTKSLPARDTVTFVLSDFKLVDSSHITFLRKRTPSGLSWKMSGSLGADGTLTLTAHPSGSAPSIAPRVFHRAA